MRRVTEAERDSLIKAYLGCATWRVESGMIVGNEAGWKIWLCDKNGEPLGLATSIELGVTVELTPDVTRRWLERVRRRLQPA